MLLVTFWRILLHKLKYSVNRYFNATLLRNFWCVLCYFYINAKKSHLALQKYRCTFECHGVSDHRLSTVCSSWVCSGKKSSGSNHLAFEGNQTVTVRFPSQIASDAESLPAACHHHEQATIPFICISGPHYWEIGLRLWTRCQSVILFDTQQDRNACCRWAWFLQDN